MKRNLPAIVALLALAFPQAAWCCGGAAGSSVAITHDAQKITVSNVGRQWLDIRFTAWGANYALRLAPGQSASPRSPGMLGQFLQAYQTCIATPLPVR